MVREPGGTSDTAIIMLTEGLIDPLAGLAQAAAAGVILAAVGGGEYGRCGP